MILYHASTAYHVLCCIVHKLAYHKDEEAVFMIVEHMLPKDKLQAFIKKIDSYSWFFKIISVPEGTFRLCHGKTLNATSSESDILEVIHNICFEVDKWYPEGFHRFQDIYVASDQWSIGVYLLHHKILYHYFEDASGMLGDEERYLTIIRDLNLSNYIMCNYLKGAGRSDVVVDKLCDMKNQPPGFFDEKAVDFSIYHIVNGLQVDTILSLLELYGATRYHLNDTKKVVVFMTQFLRTLTIKNLEVQEHMTALLLDYFAEESQIIIKPHPKDRWINYKKLIPDALLLESSLPSELLPFVLEGDVDLVLTASSTSIGGMAHIASRSISFGTDIELHYERLHDMYVTAMLVKEVYQGQEILTNNIRKFHLEHFLSQYNRDFTHMKEGAGTIYIDGGQYVVGESLERRDWKKESKDILLFLNFYQRYDFLMRSELVANNFIIIHIHIEHQESFKEYHRNLLQNNSTPYNNPKGPKYEDKEIWVYCEEEKERKIILNINQKKLLKYSDLEIEISSKEATYAMILNGKMKAMQYALRQKENEEQNLVLNKIKDVIKQYQDEEITKRVLLEEEGIIHE